MRYCAVESPSVRLALELLTRHLLVRYKAMLPTPSYQNIPGSSQQTRVWTSIWTELISNHESEWGFPPTKFFSDSGGEAILKDVVSLRN